MREEKNHVELEIVTLDCGHTLTPQVGAGICSECGKICCGKCLQLIDDMSLCPSCFKKIIGKKNG